MVLAIGPTSLGLTKQQTNMSSKTCWTIQQATLGPSSTHQCAHTSYESPQTQQPVKLGTGPLTSRKTLDPGPLTLQQPTEELNYIHQWGNTKPRRSWGSTARCLNSQTCPPVNSSLFTKQGLATNQTGTSHVYQTAHNSKPATKKKKKKKKIHMAHIGNTPRACSSGDQRGMHCWDT